MKKQKGFIPVAALAIIAGALFIGLLFQKGTKVINHPVEQAAEKVLAQHGIDIDFSAEKIKEKERLNGKQN